MAKTPKLKLSNLVNSFQLCRPKDPSSWVSTPLPLAKTYMFSPPFNSKSYDISFPSFPDPPPSTPNEHSSSKRNTFGPSKISPSPLGYRCDHQPNSRKLHEKSSKLKYDHERASSIVPSRSSTHDHKSTKESKTKKNTKASVSTSISSINSDDSLLSSPINSLKATNVEEEELLNKSKKTTKQKSVGAQRFKRFGSKEWKDGVVTAQESAYDQFRGEKPASRKSVSCTMDGRGKKSFIVEKKSLDPYEDFKKSMLEMILEKQIFEPKELEKLLMSFLSLNSRIHHRVIIEAFTEIWKELFCA